MRLISLAPSNTEILYALGMREDIVAVTHLCDYPKKAKNKIKIGTWIKTDAKLLKKYMPDLIFTSYFLPDSLKEWDGPGEIIHVEPKTLDDVYKSILLIGASIGRKSQAKKLVMRMKNQLKKTILSKPPKLKVYMEEWHEPPYASGNWVPELVEIAGGVEGIVKKGEASREFQFEELVSFDPDIIICHWCGSGNRRDPDRVLKRKGWENLRAIRNKKVYFIDDSLINRPGPRLTDGIKEIQKIILSYTS